MQASTFSPINHDDEAINRIQDQVAKVVNPLVASPLGGAVLVKNVPLKMGSNVVAHQLGRKPQGFEVARIHSTIQPIDWTPFAYQNSWSAATFGGVWPIPGYRLSGEGRVQLRGLIQNPGIPANSGISTFPLALSPQDASSAGGRLFVVPIESNTAARWLGRVDLFAPPGSVPSLILQGNVYGGTPGGASIGDLSVDGISWTVPIPPIPTLADNLDSQTEDATKVIRITSSGPCTVDLIFF